MTAWIVVDNAPPIDPVQLKTALGDFPASVDVASGNGVTVLRIGLKLPEQIAAHTDGSNLTVILSPHIGSGSVETRNAMGFRALDNIAAVLAGRRPIDPLWS